jgi:hypothetical protein
VVRTAKHDIGQASFQAAQRFFRGLALETFAFVVAAAGAVGLPDLGDGHHVQRMVDTSVAGSGESVADLVAGGRVDRGGSVVGREVVLGRESVDGRDFGEDAAGDDGADAVEVGQVGAGAVDEFADLLADGFHLGVERADVVEMLLGQL